MTEIINRIMNWINQYYGNAIFLVMAIFAYAYLFVKDKDSRVRVIYPALLIAFVIVNPILYKYIFSKIIYWRLLWMLPISIMIAVAIVRMIQDCKNFASKLVVLGIIVICIVAKGTNAFENGGFTQAQNPYKISQDVVEVCDAILELDDNPRCIMPATLYSEVRQYSGQIETIYGRDMEGYIVENLYWNDSKLRKVFSEMEKRDSNYEFVFQSAAVLACNFVVLPKEKSFNYLKASRYNFHLVKESLNYNIYYNSKINKFTRNGWAITRHFSEDDKDGVFYTIEDKDDNLIIIDGGTNLNTSNVRNVIAEHNNHVSAWIITNSKEEHVGAFNEIVQNHEGIWIEKLYTVDIEYSRYKEYETLENFKLYEELLISKDILRGCLHHVREGEVIDVLGMEMKIMHTWNDETNILTEGLADNGSMCFLLSGNNESILYCSDIDTNAINQIAQKEKMDYDYLQYSGTNYEDVLDLLCHNSIKYIFCDEMLKSDVNDSEGIVLR